MTIIDIINQIAELSGNDDVEGLFVLQMTICELMIDEEERNALDNLIDTNIKLLS